MAAAARMAAMSTGAPMVAKRANWPWRTVASIQSWGGQSIRRGGASSTCAYDGARLRATSVRTATGQARAIIGGSCRARSSRPSGTDERGVGCIAVVDHLVYRCKLLRM
jgi:hypothetical protein